MPFEKELTLCGLCRKEIIVRAYEERNQELYCDECYEDNSFFIVNQHKQVEVLKKWARNETN